MPNPLVYSHRWRAKANRNIHRQKRVIEVKYIVKRKQLPRQSTFLPSTLFCLAVLCIDSDQLHVVIIHTDWVCYC